MSAQSSVVVSPTTTNQNFAFFSPPKTKNRSSPSKISELFTIWEDFKDTSKLKYIGMSLLFMRSKAPAFIRAQSASFHSSAPVSKVGVSIVKPVHHTVKYRKAQISEKYRELLIPKNDIRSSSFRPTAVSPDRVADYERNTVDSDMLLITYNHRGSDITGQKVRQWDGTSPYHLNRAPRPPSGTVVETKDIKTRDVSTIPRITEITLNCFVKEGKENTDAVIPAILQLQQITSVKPTQVFSKTNVPTWKLRPGVLIGAKVSLKGRPMHQFLSTLSEIVLPRSKTFTSVSNGAGDRNGNIAFGLTAEDVRYFPEIEGNQDLWPRTFGMDVTIHTSAQVDPEARTLISAYSILFSGKEKYPLKW